MGLELQCRATLPDNIRRRISRPGATKTKDFTKSFTIFHLHTFIKVGTAGNA